VGEVFIIAGQSNAQGLVNQTGELNVAIPLPTYDGVRVQPLAYNPNDILDYKDGSSIDQAIANFISATVPVRGTETEVAGKQIGPVGNSLWYWASLGEQLSARLQVPVAFYNAAWSGTTIKSWEESKNGTTRPDAWPIGNVITGVYDDNRYPNGAPYRLLRAALWLYGKQYGFQSVLCYRVRLT
jgi:hypothetical protein